MMTALLCALLLSGNTFYGEADFGSSWIFWSDSRPEKTVVALPHDAMLTEERDVGMDGGGATGYYPGGKYYYEKNFKASAQWLQSHITLHFDGVYRNCRVYLNDVLLRSHANGYMPFKVCLDGALKKGNNLLRVEVDNSLTPNSRWYSGAGIFRPVKLTIQPRKHISSVRIKTLSIHPARIAVDVQHNGKNVKVDIYDGPRRIAGVEGSHCEMEIPSARLWSAEEPHLYKAVVRMGKDQVETEFGIRLLEWSREKGFQVNGESVLLKGGCLHHDNGILGAAEYEEAADRRIALLKSFGFNAIRSSHNPASEVVLSACDHLGMYVMDESWDMWFQHKNTHDYASSWMEHYTEDLEEMVEHDFNHPSVIMYSVGNELSEPALEGGMDKAREIIGLMHMMDPSRPVTAGINLMILASTAQGKGLYSNGGDSVLGKASAMSSQEYNALVSNLGALVGSAILSDEAAEAVAPVLDLLDIAGYNYGSSRYPLDGSRIIVGSETFPQDIARNWEMVKKYPYLIGDFMWTAWDYIGEAGVGAWSYEPDAKTFDKPYPWLLADAGAFDLTGQPGAEAFLARSVWTEGEHDPYICVSPIEDGTLVKAPWRGHDGIPSWSWRGCEGQSVRVEVFSNAPEVELLLNGKSLGRKSVEGNTAKFETLYQPGTLKAIAFYGPSKKRSAYIQSATGTPRIAISPEKPSCSPGNLVFVDIDIVGENGERESKADDTIRLSVEGGVLLGFGSARPRTQEHFQSGEYTSYYGHAQAALRAAGPGIMTLTAMSVRHGIVTKHLEIK